jgi:SAM-dependent methyltransferase
VTVAPVSPRSNGDGSDPDDWDEHWDTFGEAAKGNPANDYRHRVVTRLLGELPHDAVLLDIGCGQGQFALDYAADQPQVRVRGVEYSAEGVRRARESARERGLDVVFEERDLLQPVAPPPAADLATYAVCSEVLEHVPDPVTLVANARTLLAPGARVVVTVPGGPRSAFDRHIGHHRHFTGRALHDVLERGGLEVEGVYRTGFPFFNLYKLAVIARGERLVRDLQTREATTGPSLLERAVTAAFRIGFRLNVLDFPLGWQLAAVAHVRETPPC